MNGSLAGVSVVVPVYRSAATLEELHQRLARLTPLEIIFIDDCSPDGSGSVLRALASSDPGVVVVSSPRNRGQQRSVIAGLGMARGNICVVMDADLQDQPEDAPRLVASLREKGCDTVFGGRSGSYEGRGRLATSRFYKRVMHLASGRRVPLDAGMFLALRTERAREALSRRPARHLIAALARGHLAMGSIPVTRLVSPDGASSYTAWRRLGAGAAGIASLLVPGALRARRARLSSARARP